MECRAGRYGRRLIRVTVTASVLLASMAAQAHHTYAMFVMDRHLTASGSVAKFEWKNPHAFIWLYVPRAGAAGEYDLIALENGSPMQLLKEGWSRTTLQPNDRIVVEYSPLRDGRPGGHCFKVTLADGKSLRCPGPGNAPSTGQAP